MNDVLSDVQLSRGGILHEVMRKSWVWTECKSQRSKSKNPRKTWEAFVYYYILLLYTVATEHGEPVYRTYIHGYHNEIYDYDSSLLARPLVASRARD